MRDVEHSVVSDASQILSKSNASLPPSGLQLKSASNKIASLICKDVHGKSFDLQRECLGKITLLAVGFSAFSEVRI